MDSFINYFIGSSELIFGVSYLRIPKINNPIMNSLSLYIFIVQFFQNHLKIILTWPFRNVLYWSFMPSNELNLMFFPSSEMLTFPVLGVVSEDQFLFSN
jgi:hypothetical protein